MHHSIQAIRHETSFKIKKWIFLNTEDHIFNPTLFFLHLYFNIALVARKQEMCSRQMLPSCWASV